MDTITLDHLIPTIFADADLSASAVWGKMVSFTKGNSYLIAAESGTGKSSLFDYIYGRRTDYSGQLLIDGTDIKIVSANEKQQLRRTQLSIVFQGFRLFPELTAWENVILKNKLTNHKSEDEIAGYFDKLGITAKRDEPVRRLSFGQQQRVASIRAVCQPFDFLMLDEPFGHLDEKNVELALSLILQEVSTQQSALLLCSLGSGYGLSYTAKLDL